MSEEWGGNADSAPNDSNAGNDCEDWGSNNASNNQWRKDWTSNDSNSQRDDRRGGGGRGRGGRGGRGGYGFNDRRRDNDGGNRFGGGGGYENRRPRGDFQGNSGEKSTFTIPSSVVGRVIGRGGATIKDLQANSGARIKVNSNRDSYDSETLVELYGSEDQRDNARQLIMDIVERPPMSNFRQD